MYWRGVTVNQTAVSHSAHVDRIEIQSVASNTTVDGPSEVKWPISGDSFVKQTPLSDATLLKEFPIYGKKPLRSRKMCLKKW